jgi:hypothetical protein
MRSFGQCCSSCQASAASFSLRLIVRAVVTQEFFTSCCVIVDPPWTTLLLVTSAQTARPMPRRSTPLCS